MTEVMRLNIKDSIERVMFLHTQLRAALDYSPVNFVVGYTGEHIQVYGNDSFEQIREAYEVSELAVKVEYFQGGMHKRFPIDGFTICVVLEKGDEGYIPEEKSNEDK